MKNSLNYVNNHNWGSFDDNKSINKLLLRDSEDFKVYFDTYLSKIFCKPQEQSMVVLSADNSLVKICATKK